MSTDKIPELLNNLGAPFGNNILRKNTKQSVISQNSTKDEQELFTQKVLVDELSLIPHNDFKDYYCLQILQAISFYLMIEDSIKEKENEKAKAQGTPSTRSAKRRNSFSVYEPERVLLKQKMESEVSILQANHNHIEAVKYIQEREIEIMPPRKNRFKNQMRVFDSRFEVAIRFLIKHLRAFIRRSKEQIGAPQSTLSPRQTYELDTLIIEDIKLMSLNKLSSIADKFEFQPNYDTPFQEEIVSQNQNRMDSDIIMKNQQSQMEIPQPQPQIRIPIKEPSRHHFRRWSNSSQSDQGSIQQSLSSQHQPSLAFHSVRPDRQGPHAQYHPDFVGGLTLLDPTNDTAKMFHQLDQSQHDHQHNRSSVDQSRLGDIFYHAEQPSIGGGFALRQSIGEEMIEEDDPYSETEGN